MAFAEINIQEIIQEKKIIPRNFIIRGKRARMNID